MPFQAGNQEYKKRQIDAGGRHSKYQLDYWEKARERVRRQMAKDFGGIYNDFRKHIKKSPASANYAIGRILGDEQEQAPNLTINFNQHTVQLHAAAVSSPILAGNGSGQAQSAEDLAQKIRQGQDGLKFLDFDDVGGK